MRKKYILLSFLIIIQYAFVNAQIPTITTHPASIIICEYGPVTFFVEATGSPVLSYQWQKDSIDINLGTHSSLVLHNLQQSDEASYRCLVSNAYGTVYSNSASLEVMEKARVWDISPNLAIYAGDTGQFSVEAYGEQPITYKWFGPQGLIPSSTDSVLTFTPVTHADAGTYFCQIANVCNSASSPIFYLTVFDPLVVNAGADTYVFYGDSTTLKGTYSGGTPILTGNWSPITLLHDPTKLRPKTKALYETTTFTFTITDLLTGFVANDDVLVTVVPNNLGIGNNTPLLLDVNIYPNPAKDILSIEIHNNHGLAQLQISDLKGNKLITQTLSPTTSSPKSLINTSTLPPGIYIVKIVQKDKLFTGKLVIMDH